MEIKRYEIDAFYRLSQSKDGGLVYYADHLADKAAAVAAAVERCAAMVEERISGPSAAGLSATVRVFEAVAVFDEELRQLAATIREQGKQ